MRAAFPAHLRPELDMELSLAVTLAGYMRGLDWAAIPMLFDLFAVTNPERMLNHLTRLRELWH